MMSEFKRLAFVLLIFVAGADARSLQGKIDRLLKKSPIAESAFVGVLVETESGQRLAARNEHRLFTPASNTKLFSSALAMERLGPQLRFETRVEARGADLVLVGGGDASLKTTDIEELAGAVAASVHSVTGNIVGDDTLFLYQPIVQSWEQEDVAGDDGPPSSALVLDDNVVAGHAVTDSALFAAEAFKSALAKRGVVVMGQAVALHRLPGVETASAVAGTVIARHESLPLLEDLRLTLHVSQNLHADLFLFDTGHSRDDGLIALNAFLTGLHIAPEEYRFYDGSGLSRKNLVTPEAVVTLLRAMLATAHREQWLDVLPVPKTGTLEHVSALSGYAQARHERRVFSILINNTTASTADARALIAKILKLIEE